MTSRASPGRTRILLICLLIPPLFLVGLTLEMYLWLEYRVWRLGEALVAEAHALEPLLVHRPRPPHVDAPLPGTFAQALQPLLPELRAFHTAESKRDGRVEAVCEDVIRGKRPMSALPRECRERLEAHRPLMQRALRASRTEAAGLPEGLHVLSPREHPDIHGVWALERLVRLAALDVRSQLDAGQADAAVETCLDGLALSRDMGHGSAVDGVNSSMAGIERLFDPCASALQRASRPSVHAATGALRHIRRGLNPLSSALREHRLQLLSSMGDVLDPEQVKALPAWARASVAPYSLGCTAPYPLIEPLVMRHILVESARIMQRMVPLVDQPLPLRTPGFEALQQQVSYSWNVRLRGLLPHIKLAANADMQRARVDLLLALALTREHRAEHGVWPTALPPLDSEHLQPPATALRLQPAAEDTLQLLPEDATLRGLEGVLGVDPSETSVLQVLATP